MRSALVGLLGLRPSRRAGESAMIAVMRYALTMVGIALYR